MADTEVPFLNGAQAGTDEEPLAGVSDYRGRPVYRSTSGRWRSALFVVVVESNAAAAAAVNAWSGTASLTPLLGAFVADSWLGRYRSIILAGTLYVLI
uniref:Uncharacterized protein n=1 Tax=Avena sativa TaxID=4498 RepID=A0ACD5WQ31_AVESA